MNNINEEMSYPFLTYRNSIFNSIYPFNINFINSNISYITYITFMNHIKLPSEIFKNVPAIYSKKVTIIYFNIKLKELVTYIE